MIHEVGRKKKMGIRSSRTKDNFLGSEDVSGTRAFEALK